MYIFMDSQNQQIISMEFLNSKRIKFIFKLQQSSKIKTFTSGGVTRPKGIRRGSVSVIIIIIVITVISGQRGGSIIGERRTGLVHSRGRVGIARIRYALRISRGAVHPWIRGII
jgi:hypothetical protein